MVCGEDGTVDTPKRTRKRPARPAAPSLADARASSGKRIPTGISEIDRVFGTDARTGESGIRVPSISLVAGGEGTGKTTLWLQVAAACRHRVLLLQTEQTVESIRETADRIGMPEAAMRRVHVEAISTLAEATEAIRDRGARLIIVDSISELTDPEHDTGDSYTNTVRILGDLKALTETRRLAMVCMVQLNNADAIAGLRKLRHKVDAVVHFEAFGDDLRLLHAPRKNRYGRTGVKSWFLMTEQGLRPCDAPEEDPTTKGLGRQPSVR
jgi:predicted ATP-dependent serine protease